MLLDSGVADVALLPRLRFCFTVGHTLLLQVPLSPVLAKNAAGATLSSNGRIIPRDPTQSLQVSWRTCPRIQIRSRLVNPRCTFTLRSNNTSSAQRSTTTSGSRTKKAAVQTTNMRLVTVIILVDSTPGALRSPRRDFRSAKILNSLVGCAIRCEYGATIYIPIQSLCA